LPVQPILFGRCSIANGSNFRGFPVNFAQRRGNLGAISDFAERRDRSVVRKPSLGRIANGAVHH
jgi:hypothetical protein